MTALAHGPYGPYIGVNSRMEPPAPPPQPKQWLIDRHLPDPAVPAAVPVDTVVEIFDTALAAYDARARLMRENPDLYLVAGHRHELHVIPHGATS